MREAPVIETSENEFYYQIFPEVRVDEQISEVYSYSYSPSDETKSHDYYSESQEGLTISLQGNLTRDEALSKC